VHVYFLARLAFINTGNTDTQVPVRQGFSLQNNFAEAWRSKQGRSIRKKAILDMQPTNLQTDIIPTGKCEVWIKDVSFISLLRTSRTVEQSPDPASPISDEKATLPNAARERRACIYTSDGNCVGILSPQLFHTLHKTFLQARISGHHANIQPRLKT